ncbi:hypothetical protein [Roseovarius salinarum]|uniref:hypothetical protein n=1 Tax=Roseovarius salinarum TaxID=1981892 RepID=UPI001E36E932|nr:hypothetical protein [Roseovarius salinarum]
MTKIGVDIVTGVRRHSARAAALIALPALLGGCGNMTEFSDRMYFDGNYYPAKVKHDRENRRIFTLTVRRIGQGIEGAREAARYEGTRYCVDEYGTSEIAWVVAPDAPLEELPISDGKMVLQGKCERWD